MYVWNSKLTHVLTYSKKITTVNVIFQPMHIADNYIAFSNTTKGDSSLTKHNKTILQSSI